MMRRKLFILLVVFCLFVGLAGCGPQGYSGEKTLYLTTGGQLASVNPLGEGQDLYDGRIDFSGSLVTMMAKKDGSGIEFVPNHAEELPTSTDGKSFLVKIREGIAWSDGTLIDASTYEYSFRMLLDPKMASSGARQLFSGTAVVSNSLAYFSGECEWEDVGIKLIDEYTLEITLDYACTDLDFWLGIGALCPVHEELFEAGMNEDRTSTTYGTTIDSIVSGGTFSLTEWVLDQKLVFTKNEGYPLSDYFAIDSIVIYLVNDATARTQMFLNGEVDSMSLSMNNYDQYAEDPRVLFTEGYVFWGFWLNEQSDECPALGNNDFRKALYYVIPREQIANDILKTNLPASFFVPRTSYVGDPLTGDGQKYRETEAGKSVKDTDDYSTDFALAREYFEKAYKALGSEKIILEVQYFETSEEYQNIVEVFQEVCVEEFGSDRIEVVLKAVPPISVYENLSSSNFQASFAAYSCSVFNPWDALKCFRSDYPGKRHTWSSEEFDNLQRESMGDNLLRNPDERLNALVRLEELLLNGLPFIPIFTNDGAVMYSDRIKLITTTYNPGVGFAQFQADITAEPKPFE